MKLYTERLAWFTDVRQEARYRLKSLLYTAIYYLPKSMTRQLTLTHSQDAPPMTVVKTKSHLTRQVCVA